MDINQVKLKRLTDHIEDDGLITVETVAGILKAKPENVNFLKDYVKAAADKLSQPDLVDQFEASLKTEAVTAPPAKPVTPSSSPPIEGEILSEPEVVATSTPTSAPVTVHAESGAPTATERLSPMQANPAPGAPTPPPELSGFTFRFRDASGVSQDLKIAHVGMRTKTILFEAKPSEEIVSVTLRGESATLNLTHLRTLPGGDTFIVNEHPYMVATLLVIADAAKG